MFTAFEVVTSFASNCWPGYCGTSKLAVSPGFELARESLRHLHVDPNRVHVGDLEQLLACPVARTNQGTDIGVARRDDAIERSDNGLEGLHGLQLPHIGLGCIGDGLLRDGVACRIVSRLL